MAAAKKNSALLVSGRHNFCVERDCKYEMQRVEAAPGVLRVNEPRRRTGPSIKSRDLARTRTFERARVLAQYFVDEKRCVLAALLPYSPTQLIEWSIHEVQLGCRASAHAALPDRVAFFAGPGAKLDDDAYVSPEQLLAMAQHLGLEPKPEFVSTRLTASASSHSSGHSWIARVAAAISRVRVVLPAPGKPQMRYSLALTCRSVSLIRFTCQGVTGGRRDVRARPAAAPDARRLHSAR